MTSSAQKTKLSPRQKLEIVLEVVEKNNPISRVCRQAGISRSFFYKLRKQYLQAGESRKEKLRALRLKRKWVRRGKQLSRTQVKEILKVVLKNPEYGITKILRQIYAKKARKIVSHGGIQTFLLKLHLNTRKKRKAFVKWARSLPKEEVVDLALLSLARYKSREPLSPEERLKALRLVDDGVPIAYVCRCFQIGRKNFYKWHKRYNQAVPGKEYQAITDRKPIIEHYWRQVTDKQVEAILKIVIEHPEYSTHKIAEILTWIGNHGVQNVFRRQNLNIYEKRLTYSQTHAPVPVVTPVTRVLDRIKPIFGKIPVISAIPPPTREQITSLVRPFVASFLSSVTLSTIFIYWLRMVSQAPTPGAKIGLFFATIALSVGSIFFAYSMKYYLTLAIVLSFSRQPLEEGTSTPLSVKGGFAVGLNGRLNNNQRNGNGWLARIFGLERGERGARREEGEIISAGGLQPSLEHIKLKRYPFVSIHLPFYNEKKVAERILSACTSMDYPNFEIIVCDDSTDETIDIVKRFAKEWNAQSSERPLIKILHRPTRQGFKGGALREALRASSPKTEFIVVFDADFIPYPDTLELFIKYFQANGLDLAKNKFTSEVSRRRNTTSEVEGNKIAAVAGYQWHVLNKSENWVTRGVRTEYAGSYVIERPGQEILGAMKLIHGSVYAIRADVLKKFGWGTSITEDFELTLKLYEAGYKVIYTPYVQAPAECASTLKRLIRQRMRWAEGHSHCVKRRFSQIMTSPLMTLTEKLEFLYLTPYYLQAFFFLIGTFSWLLAETVFRARLPFWTSLWGWSLVLTNFFSLPLVNAVGLFLEESEEKDYLGLFSFIALSYILVPFQAYASIKGFLEEEEGPWFRTPKTGLITDIFTRGRFYRWISGILPGRIAPVARMSADRSRLALSPYLALATANNRFDKSVVEQESPLIPFFDQSKQFAFLGVKVARRVVFSKATLALLLVVTMFLNYLAFFTVETGRKGEKVEMVETGEKGGGTEIFRGEPVNTNLIENKQVTSFESGVVYAAESERSEIYRWQVKLPRGTTYSFGLQESRGVRPVVKMENEVRGGNFIRFEPDSRMGTNAGAFGSLKRILTNERIHVEPKVEGNSIEWEIGEGITAKYTSLADRIKADYIIENGQMAKWLNGYGDRLSFRVEFSDEEENPRIFEQNKDGSISLILDNYSDEVFRFLAPNAKDAKGIEGEAKMSIQKIAQGTAILTISLDPAFLTSATYPITIDPTTLNSSADLLATAYGSQRHIIRDSYGKLLAVYLGSTRLYARWSNDNGATWESELLLMNNTCVTYFSPSYIKNFSIAIDGSKMYLSYEDTSTVDIKMVRWTIERDGSNNITGLGSSNNGCADTVLITLDDSAYAYRPSLIVTNMGSNDHVAVAWSFYGQSGGTKSGGARFMHCKLSNDCTSLANWCGANANTGATECGTAATSLTADGDVDPIMVAATKTARHVVLNQQSPTGTGTYAKDLVVVLGDDAATTLGTGSTGWGDTANCGDATTNCWASWSSDVDNITGTQYDDADGFNLTLAQDNLNKELVLGYHDTTNSHLEALRLGENDQPSAAAPWQDLSFPTGDNKDPTVGVDNTDGIYYNFYKNVSGYIAFRFADGTNFGTKLGYDTAGGTSASVTNTIRGSEFTLSTTKTFNQIKAYLSSSFAFPGTGPYRAAIYTDDGGSPSKPSTLVIQTNEQYGGGVEGAVWVSFSIEPTTLSSGTYWLVINSSHASAVAYYNSGTTNQGISASSTYGNFPLTFPTGGTNDDNQYSIYAQVGWSGEIVLDQAATSLAYPSVSEASDTTNKKMDLIYTGGTSPYSVYYHTWHFEERYSRQEGQPPGTNDATIFFDEKGYDNVSLNDNTNYENQSTTDNFFKVFIFKVKNTDRATYPQINPTWNGQTTNAPSSYTVYLQVYDRNSASWAACDDDSSTGADTDFDLTCTKDTNLDYYYFADDWTYFRVYQAASTGTLKTDYFNPSPFIVPEKTLLTLLLVAIFLPKMVRRFRYATIKVEDTNLNELKTNFNE